jgi:hypothetical protein
MYRRIFTNNRSAEIWKKAVVAIYYSKIHVQEIYETPGQIEGVQIKAPVLHSKHYLCSRS